MANKITKAGGNIVQADWLQTDPSKMDYIHNKPDLENIGGLTEEEVIEIINENLPDIPQPLTEQQVKNIVNNTIPAGTNAAIVRNASGVLDKTTVSSGIDANSIAVRDDKGRLKSANGVTNWTWGDAFQNVKLFGVENAVITTNDLKEFVKTFPLDIQAMDNAANYDAMLESRFLYSSNLKGWIICPNNGGYVDLQSDSDWSIFAISDVPSKSSYIPLKTSNGQLKVNDLPVEGNDAASKLYVDSKIQSITVSNRLDVSGSAKTIISSSVRFGDLMWVTDPEAEACVGNPGLFMGTPILPGDENTVYSLSVELPTFSTSDQWFRSAGGCPPVDETILNMEGPEWVDYVCSETSGMWYYTTISSDYVDGQYIYTYAPTIREITQTGPWKIVFGECSGGASLEDLLQQKEVYKDAMVHYSYELYEEYPAGPVHSIDLHSDQELHYDYPLTELTINNFVHSFPQNIAQQWTISFIAGDESPLILIPQNVKYVNAIPVFEPNKKYLMTFKEINGDFFCIWSVIE